MSRPKPGTLVCVADLTPGLYIDVRPLISKYPGNAPENSDTADFAIVNHVTPAAGGKTTLRSSEFTGVVDSSELVKVVG